MGAGGLIAFGFSSLFGGVLVSSFHYAGFKTVSALLEIAAIVSIIVAAFHWGFEMSKKYTVLINGGRGGAIAEDVEADSYVMSGATVTFKRSVLAERMGPRGEDTFMFVPFLSICGVSRVILQEESNG